MASWRSLKYPMGVLGLALQRYPKASLFEETDSSRVESSSLRKISRLTYMSTMCGNQAKAAKHVENMVEQSARANLQSNLSGHLIYDADMKKVWQVVEGNHDTVAELWERISEDTRHVIDIDAISHEIVDTRKYPAGRGIGYTKFEQAVDREKRQEFGLRHSTSLCQESPDQVVIQSTDQEIVQIKYKSFVKDEDSAPAQMAEQVIPHAIVESAEHDITGFVLYNNNNKSIYQVLEGPAVVVETLFDKIQKDPRHDVCAASVQRRIVQEREYPSSSMAMEQVALSPWTRGAAY